MKAIQFLLFIPVIIFVGSLIYILYPTNTNARTYNTSGFKTVTIDSCEYINYYNKTIVHKGNCRYCIERRKAVLEALFDKTKEEAQ